MKSLSFEFVITMAVVLASLMMARFCLDPEFNFLLRLGLWAAHPVMWWAWAKFIDGRAKSDAASIKIKARMGS